QNEVADRSMMIAPLLEVPCQRTGNRGGPRAVGTLEPFADPLMQSHAPTARHSFGDGVGIQAVGEAVTRDLRAVGSYGRPLCNQELAASGELVAELLDCRRIRPEAGRDRSCRELVSQQARCFEQALRFGLLAIDLRLDQRAQALGERARDLCNGSSQPPAVV